ncbi:MAG: ABC transporter ATP-binding protein [Candidatus Calescibacterium sp.]|nr:ABC transporter ATP-binding protein [Candidatus Calescibacterium sp.]MCX7972789.1 ABC transporter ATP-binding protein [bacterium]MDW8195863.1 ABC transporter ATP-binding protein [Candidatus Calescibacterium sp.]
MLKIENLNKFFGKQQVLYNINFEINKGVFLSILGPSGCGKTTLLRCIAGLEEVQSGKIYINNRDVTHLHPSKRNIAMVFQTYALYPHMTVRDNITIGLRIQKLDKKLIQERLNKVVEFLNIQDILDKYPGQISGGQRQRVAIARALVKEPDIFLFDEPLSNLDALLREKAREEIKKILLSLNATAVFVTHDQVEAMSLSDYIIVMDKGKVMQFGTPEEIYNNPQNFFTASFVGSPQINYYKCIVTEENIILENKLKLEKFANFPQGNYILAIRPEKITFGHPDSNSIKLEGKVLFYDNLGSQFLISVILEGLIFRFISKEKIEKNTQVQIFLPIHQILFFNQQGERVEK